MFHCHGQLFINAGKERDSSPSRPRVSEFLFVTVRKVNTLIRRNIPETAVNKINGPDTNVSHSPEVFAKNLVDEEFIKHYFCNIRQDSAVPLKLILIPLRSSSESPTFMHLLEMEFGPLHAALQIGDVILEWNDSSLVVPHFCQHDDPLLKADTQQFTEWVDFTLNQRSRMKNPEKWLESKGQIELVMVKKIHDPIIEALVKLIVNYNSYHWYKLINHNCQHFVLDAFKVLQVNKPAFHFTGGLSKHLKTVKSGKSPSVPVQYKNHAELDLYVKEHKEKDLLHSMPQKDLEFLLAQYFQFHLQDKSQYCKKVADLEKWECKEKDCLMHELEKHACSVNRFENTYMYV